MSPARILAACCTVLLLSGCARGVAVPAGPPPGGGTVATEPVLIPAFDPTVSDYAVRCNGDPVAVRAEGRPQAPVSVDGGAPQTAGFEQNVPLAEGEAFGFTVAGHGYRARCLPHDFPAWSLQPAGGRLHEIVGLTTFPPRPGAYAVFFDRDGVPIWWKRGDAAVADLKVLPGGEIAYADNGVPAGQGYELVRPDGMLVGQPRFAGGQTNIHDLEQMPNGDLLLVGDVIRRGVDVSAYGGPKDANLNESEIEEIDPQGKVVWSWRARDHIGLAETGRWWPWALANPPYDIHHINSVEPNGGSLIASFRHLDAVYSINRRTGAIEWKLGGTRTPKSLKVVGDPYGDQPFGGQHDARLDPDGTLTAFDNEVFKPRLPRVVRYRIDPAARTATYLDSIPIPGGGRADLAGSARRLPDGGLLISWGGGPLTTETSPGGKPTRFLSYEPDVSSFRAFPVPPHSLSEQALRDGMSAMHPRAPASGG